MDLEIIWWQWMVLGIGLAILEIFLPSFISLWFGLGAIIVGMVAWLFPHIAVPWQVLIWIVASGVFVVIWFRYFKPKMIDKTKAGIAREAAIGETGRVIKAPTEGGRGLVRFSLPVLGEDEWSFICEGSVSAGDKVAIRDFSGNDLVVEKLDQ
jgi:inner membrane protein